MPRQFFSQKVNSLKAISLIAVLAMAATSYVISATTALNIIPPTVGDPGDPATLRQAKTGGAWTTDALNVAAGDTVKFLVYYHCSTDAVNWSEIKANNTAVRMNLPTTAQTSITPTTTISATGLTSKMDARTINISTSQKLDFTSGAIWYHNGLTETILSTDTRLTYGPGYIQFNPGIIQCDLFDIASGNICYENAGQVVFTATVASSFPKPTVILRANGSEVPITINYNTKPTLTWTSTDVSVNGCTASSTSNAWTGAGKAASNSVGEQPTSNQTSSVTYTIVCIGPGGTSDPDSVVVNVQSLPPTVDIKARNKTGSDVDGPITINYNTSTFLTWTTTNNPDTCTTSCVSGDCGSWAGQKNPPTSSWTTGNLLSTSRVYSIFCSNSAGSSNTDTVMVQVAQCLPMPPTAPF